MSARLEVSGSTDLFCAEEVSRKWFPTYGTFVVEVVREAVLSANLADIRVRRLREIRLWWDKPSETYMRLDREQAQWLVEALSDAIAVTEEFADGSIWADDPEDNPDDDDTEALT